MIWLLGMAALATVAAAIWDWLDPIEDPVEQHRRTMRAIAPTEDDRHQPPLGDGEPLPVAPSLARRIAKERRAGANPRRWT